MRDRSSTFAPIAVVVGIFGLCCGLPTLLSLGVLGAVAGMSLQSSILILLGLGLAVVGWVRWMRRRRNTDPSCGVSVRNAPGPTEAEQTHDTSSNGTPS